MKHPLFLSSNKYKGVIIIIAISKDEAFAMRKQFGNYAVKKTYTHHPHYYLVENTKFLKALDKYRKAKVIYTCGG